jgi:hypothetical protein
MSVACVRGKKKVSTTLQLDTGLLSKKKRRTEENPSKGMP